jgi:RNA polymerase sigma factor (sigma-70 family)
MSFRLWLRKTAQQQVGLARRTHIERYRRSVLREETGLSRSSRLIARGLMSAAAASPSEKLARRELEQRVAVAVAQLSDADRETVIMRNVEGLNFEEIALVLDLNPPAVRQRYGRALIRLRTKLKGGRSKDSEL